jgi:hypothetical protein
MGKDHSGGDHHQVHVRHCARPLEQPVRKATDYPDAKRESQGIPLDLSA